MSTRRVPYFLKHYPEDYRSTWVQAVVGYPGYAWNANPMWHLMGRTERFVERMPPMPANYIIMRPNVFYTYTPLCKLAGSHNGPGSWEKVFLVWQLEIAALSGEPGDRVCWDCFIHLLQMQDFFITPVRAAGLVEEGAIRLSWQFGRALI